jgi:hypothetical protein
MEHYDLCQWAIVPSGYCCDDRRKTCGTHRFQNMTNPLYNVVRHPISRQQWYFYFPVIVFPLMLIYYDVHLDGRSGPRFMVPLVNGYIAYSAGRWGSTPAEMQAYGAIQVLKLPKEVELDSDPVPLSLFFQDPTDSPNCIRHIVAIAVTGDNIVGQTESGYFVLDTHNSKLDLYGSYSGLSAALSASHVSVPPLQRPMDMDVTLPNRIIRPWAYQVENGAFGLSDSGWSAITVDGGLLITIIVGLIVPRGNDAKGIIVNKLTLAICGLVSGYLTADVAYGSILRSGPDTMVGTFVLAPWFAVVAVTSREIPILLRASNKMSL